jgi:flagellar M-ring protein FliF
MLEEVLGLNKAIARVSTEIDFQEVSIIEERYDPKPVIRSEQKSSEKSSSTPSRASSLERQNEVRNYEISKVNKQIKNPVGSVKRISVAVIVDGTYKETAGSKGSKARQYIPRPPEEMKNLEVIIKRAMGYDEKRGDQVELINMPFSWAIQEEDLKPEKGVVWKEYVADFYKPVISLFLMLLFTLFVVRPLLKRRPSLPKEDPVPLLAPGEQSAVSGAPQVTETNKSLKIRDQILEWARQDPTKTAGIVKTWLREKE